MDLLHDPRILDSKPFCYTFGGYLYPVCIGIDDGGKKGIFPSNYVRLNVRVLGSPDWLTCSRFSPLGRASLMAGSLLCLFCS